MFLNGVCRHERGHVLRIGTPKGYNHCYDTWMDGQQGREPDHKSWIYTSLQFLNGVCRHEQLQQAVGVPADFLNGVCRHEPSIDLGETIYRFLNGVCRHEHWAKPVCDLISFSKWRMSP